MLENIRQHRDLVDLTPDQRQQLCSEIRRFLLEHVSKTGGHVSSNLGVVELTVALETVFDTAKDRLVFDVGHQSYIHKMLTGRQEGFSSLRQFGGMAGFPKPSESETDAFVAGHASSAVSIGLGMARARTLQGQDYQVVVVMGDGAATGGMAYEGLNDAAVSAEPMIIILNDNELSIDRNVGGLALHLQQLRTKERYLGIKQKYRRFLLRIPGGRKIYTLSHSIKDRLRRMLLPTTIFECMGFTYLGPVDGHDTEHLIRLLQIAKDMKCPVLLHVTTQKGRGYAPAEEHPKLFHGIGKFDLATGEPATKCCDTFSAAFGKEMLALAREDARLCAITAAMPGGTGLLEFKEQYPRRLFDVGIAEEHAVSMAGGLAKQGMIPVVALYSTFLQRSYDMILQDICIQRLHAILAVDRAGLVGEDGETHHGIFDVGFLRQAPGMQVLCPASTAELRQMLRWAALEQSGPVAIRYPRGGNPSYTDAAWGQGTVCIHRHGQDAAIITYGTLLNNAMEAAQILAGQGISVAVIRLLRINPLDMEEIAASIRGIPHIFVAEEVSGACAIWQELAAELAPEHTVYGLNLGKNFVQHGAMDDLYRHYGLSGQRIADSVLEVCQSEN